MPCATDSIAFGKEWPARIYRGRHGIAKWALQFHAMSILQGLSSVLLYAALLAVTSADAARIRHGLAHRLQVQILQDGRTLRL